MTSRVFVTLDGGLLAVNPESTALSSLRLQSGCIRALASFRDAGFGIVLLIEPRAAADPVAEDAGETLVTTLFESQGIVFEAIARCDHMDAACDCALPGIGLVSNYLADASFNRDRSLIVGRGAAVAGLARAMGVAGHDLEAGSDWPQIAHAVLDRPRRARVSRTTRETDIQVEVDLDLTAPPVVSTGIGFFDHMLEQLGKHGGFALSVRSDGDLEVDEHHTVEDVALTLGQALREALGDKRGIDRYGFVLPMDEAQAKVAIDLSGRAYCVFEADFGRESVGGLPTELVGHFFRSLAETLGAAIHVTVTGSNAHHMIEACFKGVARALAQAFVRRGSELPSTKGSL